MSFNVIHYVVFLVLLLLAVVGVIAVFRQPNKKLIPAMLFSIALVIGFLSVLSVFVVDKYTKKVRVYKVKNKRFLSQERIVYTGLVKNVGSYTVGEVKLSIKLVNEGHQTGKIQKTNFFTPRGLGDLLSNKKTKPQVITKEFVIAKNIKPGEVRTFSVSMKYPGYFRNTSDFIKVYAH